MFESEMLPGISGPGACIEVAARSGTWGSECPLSLLNQTYRYLLIFPRSVLWLLFAPRSRRFTAPSVVWLVTVLFGFVCGLTCCRRGKSKAMPHPLRGSSTFQPRKPRLELHMEPPA